MYCKIVTDRGIVEVRCQRTHTCKKANEFGTNWFERHWVQLYSSTHCYVQRAHTWSCTLHTQISNHTNPLKKYPIMSSSSTSGSDMNTQSSSPYIGRGRYNPSSAASVGTGRGRRGGVADASSSFTHSRSSVDPNQTAGTASYSSSSTSQIHPDSNPRYSSTNPPPTLPSSGIPYGHVPSYLPGSASLVEQLDQRLLVVLRDGRHLIGV